MQAHHHIQSVPDCFGFKPNPPHQNPYLTPPHSALDLSPKSNTDHDSTQICVSTQFYPGALLSQELADVPADLVIQSGDAVFFYVHSVLLRHKSSNNFANLLPSPTAVATRAFTSKPDPVFASVFIKTPLLTPNPSSCSESTPPASPSSSRTSLASSSLHAPDTPSHASEAHTIITIAEASPVFNLVLHVLYGLPFFRYSPDLDTLSQIFPFSHKYGLSISDLVPPHSEVSSTLLSMAAQRPLEVYTLAAQNKMHDLAVQASQYTLNVSLSILTDQQSMDMGPLYLKWLFFLHLGRSEALKRILVQPLEPHSLGLGSCNPEDQKALGRAWGLVTAYILSTTSMQNVSVGMLNTTYGSMAESVRCYKCKETLQAQVRSVVDSWLMVQSTI